MSARFDGKMVLKPWGMEYCAYDDGNVAVWYLHLKAGERTSMHKHEKKTTMIRIAKGHASCTHEGAIHPGVVHSTLAHTDTWVVEIETPSDKLDLVRVGDDYGRLGKPYENGENVIDFDARYAYPSTEFPA